MTNSAASRSASIDRARRNSSVLSSSRVGRIDAAPAAPPPHVRGALGDEVLGGRRRRRVRCVPVPAARRRVPVPRARRRVLVLFAR
ncbi:predicted protein [Streptomyces sp. SPB78]|nr:predicted protein [Streptomyces sp. SPB78]